MQPASSIDPFSVGYITDPYPYHRALRSLGPMVWLARYRVWCVTRYKETLTVLSHPKQYCSSGGVGLTNHFKETPWRTPSLLLEADQPAHTARRALVFRVLSGENAARLRRGFEAVAAALVDRILAQREFDAIAELAQAYTLKAFPDAVGLAAEGREHLLPYGAMVFNGFGPRNAIFAASLADVEPRVPWIMAACRRENLRSGGLGELVYRGADAGEVTHEEALLLVRSFLSAGLDTTVDAIGNALHAFAQFPGEWRKLHADPARARNAIEEVMRYEPAFQTFFRTTTEAVELGGVSVAANEKVMISMGCVNRDPARWERPDEFDIERRTAGHMGFGAGIHGCIGQVVARLEIEVLLSELARRVAAIELIGPTSMKLHNTLRGFARLPLRLTPA